METLSVLLALSEGKPASPENSRHKWPVMRILVCFCPHEHTMEYTVVSYVILNAAHVTSIVVSRMYYNIL